MHSALSPHLVGPENVLVEELAVHGADQVRVSPIDNEVAGHALAFRYVAINVRCAAARELRGSRTRQLAAAEQLWQAELAHTRPWPPGSGFSTTATAVRCCDPAKAARCA